MGYQGDISRVTCDGQYLGGDCPIAGQVVEIKDKLLPARWVGFASHESFLPTFRYSRGIFLCPECWGQVAVQFMVGYEITTGGIYSRFGYQE